MARAELLRHVEHLIRDGTSRLGRDFELFWPNDTARVAHEANLALHVGRAFIEAGFATFAESSLQYTGAERVDLVGYDPVAQALVAVECKNLGTSASSTNSKGMASDYQRLRSYSGVQAKEFREAKIELEHRIGVLLAFCYRSDLYRWWWDEDEVRTAAGAAGADELKSALAKADRVGGQPIYVDTSGLGADPGAITYAVWAIFDLSDVT